MKGLLYRDLCLSKKNWLTILGLSVGTIIWNLLVQLSFVCGNLKDFMADDASGSAKMMIYYIGLYNVPYFSLIMMETVQIFRSDFASKFVTYRKMFPVTAVQWAGSQYLLKLIFMLISLILFTVNGLLMAHINGKTFGIYEINNMLLFVCFYQMFDIVQMAFLSRARTQKDMNLCNVSPLFVIVPLYVLAYGKAKEIGAKYDALFPENETPLIEEADITEKMEQMKSFLQSEIGVYRDQIAPYLWLIVLALMGIGFYLTYLGIRRREN